MGYLIQRCENGWGCQKLKRLNKRGHILIVRIFLINTDVFEVILITKKKSNLS